tara:strand:+ start:37 stop:2130 length:2094 start_codon:yes stop_codon:yes gene_type:complete
VAQANVKLTVDATQAQRALKGVQAQSVGLQNQLGKLKAAFAGIAFTAVARQATATASNFQALQLRMQVLTSEFGEFAQAQELVRKAQDKFNLSIIEATKGVTDIFARLRPLGISLKDIETTFIGFNTIAKLAGLSATEASAAFTQLAQGLGSGRLQGDEFRSIAEQVPQLLKAISDETGIASGKLKDFASKGLLKSDIILRALAKSAEEGADKIGAIMDASPAEVFKAFSNAVLELQLTLGSKLLPVVLQVTKSLTALIERVVSFVDSEAGQVTFAFVGIAAAVKGLSFAMPLLASNFLAVKVSAQIATGTLVGMKATLAATSVGFASATAAATAFKVALAKTGLGLVIIGLTNFIAKILEANNAQKEFNKLLEEGTTAMIKSRIAQKSKELEELKEKLDEANKALDIFGVLIGLQNIGGVKGITAFKKQIIELQDEIKKLEEGIPAAQARDLTKEFQNQLANLQKQNEELNTKLQREKIIGEEKKDEFDLEQQIAKIKEQNLKPTEEARLINLAKANDSLDKQLTKVEKINEAAKRQAEIFEQIGESIATGVSDALTDAVMGAKTLGEAAVGVLRNIQRQLVQLGINTLLFNIFGGKEGIFKNLPTFAAGGMPPVGKPSIVGEKGPEIFVPSSAGTIIPNNKIGGGGVVNNINISVDASNTNVEGDDASANQLGELIAAAVQTEIINQQMSGGLLS